MRMYWMWLVFGIGGILDLMLITWYFPVERDRRLLGIFYGMLIPLAAGWKVFLIFREKSMDILLLFFVAVLILGTWWITKAKLGGVLTVFAFLYIGGSGSELLSMGIVQAFLGLPVLPVKVAEGTMACVMLANVFLLIYLMIGNWFWKRYAQGKRVNRDFLLFFFVLTQNIYLFWMVYCGFEGVIRITAGLLFGTAMIVFGTMSFSFVRIHHEETKELEDRLKKIELQMQKDYERYRELEEKERMLHQIRHDFNNHLAMVYYLAKDGKEKQAKQLLEEMEHVLRDEQEKADSKNFLPKKDWCSFAWEKSSHKFSSGQIFLLPIGQVLLIPSVWKILEYHWGSILLFVDCAILFCTVGVDGLWLLLFFSQHKRKKYNERLLTDICRQQMEQNRKDIAFKGIQEGKELRKELLSCIAQARSALEASRKLSVVQGYLFHAREEEFNRHCTNELVNTVLEEKQKHCRSLHISFSAQMEVPEELEIKASHLCSIFTNLLDNGINACRYLPADLRWISIQSKIQGDYLYIRVENSMAEDYPKHPRLPGHGLGKQIIARLAAEYQGDYWVKEDANQYAAVVVLQICGKSKMTSNETG